MYIGGGMNKLFEQIFSIFFTEIYRWEWEGYYLCDLFLTEMSMAGT